MRNNKPEGVIFFRYVDYNKNNELMTRAHTMHVHVVQEGREHVVTEANALDTLSVGYDVHRLRDSIRNGETGLLCDDRLEAMTDKVFGLSKDDTLHMKHSRNALAWAGEFNWDRSAQEFLKAMTRA